MNAALIASNFTPVKRVLPEEFLTKWIFKLYHVEPENDQRKYKEACILELQRLCPDAKRDTIRTQWLREGGDRPKLLETILDLADQRYSALEALKHLPNYSEDLGK